MSIDETAVKTEAPEVEVQEVETPPEAETTQAPDSPESDQAKSVESQSAPDEKLVPESRVTYHKSKLRDRLRRQKQESEQTIEELRQSNQLLQMRLEQATTTETAAPTLPTLAGCDYDEDLFARKNAEYNEYLLDQKLNQRLSERDKANQGQRIAEQRSSQLDEQLEKHAKDAESLKINDYDTALNMLSVKFGVESAEAMISDGVVSAATVNYFYKNPDKADLLAQKAKTRPLAAFKEIVELNSSLVGKAEPSESIPTPKDRPEGGRSGGNSFQSRADAIRDDRDANGNYDMQALLKVKREAKAAGVEIE